MPSILLPYGTTKVTKIQWLPQGLHRTMGDITSLFFHTFINLYMPHLLPKRLKVFYKVLHTVKNNMNERQVRKIR